MTPRTKFDLTLLPERPDLSFELALWRKGCQGIAGVDEAGRGALLGPVSAGAVVLPCDQPDLAEALEGVQDSKVMRAEERESWAVVIKQVSISWAVGFASAYEIDTLGIAPATCLAASRALARLTCKIEHVLIDYITLPDVELPQTPLIKGDARSLSIAAASILAKTARDALLVEMSTCYPGYHLQTNKGYATEAHRDAIAALGPCVQHRCTFSPVTEYVVKVGEAL